MRPDNANTNAMSETTDTLNNIECDCVIIKCYQGKEGKVYMYACALIWLVSMGKIFEKTFVMVYSHRINNYQLPLLLLGSTQQIKNKHDLTCI